MPPTRVLRLPLQALAFWSSFSDSAPSSFLSYPSYWDRSSPDLAQVERLAPDGPSPLWGLVQRPLSAPVLPILQLNMTCCCRSRCPVVSDRVLYFLWLQDFGSGV